MLTLIISVLCFCCFAQNSLITEVFLKAAKLHQNSTFSSENYVLRPDIRKILDLFIKHNIGPDELRPYLHLKVPALVPADKFDYWQKIKYKKNSISTPISLHVVRLDVINSEDWLGDSLYGYFFITDGNIPSGKVTGIYSNISSGQSFYFNAWDRMLYPIGQQYGRIPHQHLIVDYGIIESDGDDVRNLQKLSSIIVDIALTVYATLEPENSSILLQLRREIKTLAEFIINLNHDDRLICSSFAYKTEEINDMIKHKTFIEFRRKHASKNFFNEWKYQIHFRILRD